ncbi:hypothetical protein Pcinc_032807 [Petrolisthes cinctipes]|uniref:Uncharacterized protein n=1 Tax=Petrolisthes cinctipes TaxID=88211 RepID=A0AAE1ETI7_PETCI|nr:hypothetical protein Pcinc_032807 [Petrolisthes cinctipes]
MTSLVALTLSLLLVVSASTKTIHSSLGEADTQVPSLLNSIWQTLNSKDTSEGEADTHDPSLLNSIWQTLHSIDSSLGNSIWQTLKSKDSSLGNSIWQTLNSKDTSVGEADTQVPSLLNSIWQTLTIKDTSEGKLNQSLLLKLIKYLPDGDHLSSSLVDSLGLHQDILKVVSKIINKIKKMKVISSNTSGSGGNFVENNNNIEEENNEAANNKIIDFNHQFLELIREVLTDEIKELPIFNFSETSRSSKQNSTEVSTKQTTTTSNNVWMLIKSTWQRILAYVKDENSIETFLQQTPVRIINNIISLGDDLNLINFLAKKLDKDFAEFISQEINPYMGPFQCFDSFYNFTKENGFNNIIDYFSSPNFAHTVSAMSRFISSYFDDNFSEDVADDYIAFISFNNTELYNFYKSLLRSQKSGGRVKREEFNKAASSYKFNGYDFQPQQPKIEDGRQISRDTAGYGGHSAASGYGGYSGGYGSGGYGSSYGGSGGYGGAVVDPAVVLSSVGIGALLGFLLFRIIRGTRNGRRDIGDGSLSLWDSDLPDQILPWGSSVDRMKRQVNDDTQSFSLPSSLRGDVWSSDPLVTDNFLDDHLDEDDIAHHLNHLWRLYKDTNETACIHSHLCDVMANSTAHHLTGKDSSLPLIMASVGKLLGVARSGQLVDEVTSRVVLGTQFSCPGLNHCYHQ